MTIAFRSGSWAAWALVALGSVTSTCDAQEQEYSDLLSEPHLYWTRELADPFTLLKEDFESGKLDLDYSSEKAFIESFLERLEIPVSSQMLVFSTTSLQLRMISPRNPRALYFNEDVYVGYVPGGRIEIVSLDPVAGGIFYIFDIPRNASPPVIDRSKRCMNCHSDDDTRHVPGLVIKSVMPGPNGGSLDSYRREDTGHHIPFEHRFGGWHLTGNPGIEKHLGNVVGRFEEGKIVTQVNAPGQQCELSRYPVPTSDILPHLLHEHQAGFVNRVLEASYRARTYLHEGNGELGTEHLEILEEQAELLTRYLLFADEVPLPPGGLEVDEVYRAAFLEKRRAIAKGLSLKDFDLETRIFRHRCSYMIYSQVFQAIPKVFKNQVYRTIGAALRLDAPHPDYAYLPRAEKAAIREILKETIPDLPDDF